MTLNQERYQDGETLDDLLPEAFATVVEAADRVSWACAPTTSRSWAGRPPPRQHRRDEDRWCKTVATCPTCTLTGKGVHVVTVNDYPPSTSPISWGASTASC